MALGDIVTVIWHTLLIYLLVIAALRLLSQRRTSEFNVPQLVMILALGSAVETSLVAKDTTLLAGLVSAATLFVANYLLSKLVRSWDWLRQTVIGRPTPVVFNGKILERQVKAAGITEEDIKEEMRERGYENLSEVRLAVLEVDGEISVIPFEDEKKGK